MIKNYHYIHALRGLTATQNQTVWVEQGDFMANSSHYSGKSLVVFKESPEHVLFRVGGLGRRGYLPLLDAEISDSARRMLLTSLPRKQYVRR